MLGPLDPASMRAGSYWNSAADDGRAGAFMTGRSHGGGKVDSSASVDRLRKAPTPQMLVAHPSAPTSCGSSGRSRHADEIYNMT